MAQRTLKELAEKMADIDFSMLLTHTEGGAIAGRPMSNNGDVEYDGDSFFFVWEKTRTVSDIMRDPKVTLSMQGKSSLFGKPPLMISVEGEAQLVRDKAQFVVHWKEELDRWFEQGVNTPGVVMIKVHAVRLHYWEGEDEGEVVL